MHFRLRAGLRRILAEELRALANMISDRYINSRLVAMAETSPINAYIPDLWLKLPDVSFGMRGFLPSLVCEISWFGPSELAEGKAAQYINESLGQIGAVLIIDVERHGYNVARVSLAVWDVDLSECDWLRRGDIFYDEALGDEDHQPYGEIELYIGDFFCDHGYPLVQAFRRPSAIDIASGGDLYILPTSFLSLYFC